MKRKFLFLLVVVLAASFIGCPPADPEKDVTQFEVSVEKNVLTVGETTKANVVLMPEGKLPYTLESDNKGVLTVSEDGTVTAVNVGKAKIYAKLITMTTFCEITVVEPQVAEIPIIGIRPHENAITVANLSEVAVVSFDYEPENTTQTGVTYGSSDESVASVDENGNVTANTEGTVIITITSIVDPSISATVQVNFGVPITGITPVDKDISIPNVNGTAQIEFNYAPANTTQTGVTFTSLNTAVAEVDENGLVTGKQEGVAVIEIKSARKPSITATVTVTVGTPLTAITPSASTFTIGKTQTSCTIDVSYVPSNTTQTGVTFTSSNTAVATVDENGVVTKQTENGGSTTITIASTTNPSITATATVTVTPVEKASLATINLTNSENNNLSGAYSRVGVYEFDTDATYANFASSGSEYLRLKGSVSDGCYIPADQSGVRFKPSDITGWTYFEVRVRATTQPNFFASAENSTPYFNSEAGITEPKVNNDRNIFTFVRPGGSGYMMGIQGGNTFGFGNNPGAVTYTNDNTYYTLGYLFDETNMKVYCYSNSTSEFCSSTPIPAGNFIPTLCNSRKYFNIGICEQNGNNFNNGVFIDYIAVYKKN